MKILQVTPFFPPSWEAGGVARASYEISKQLVKQGHEVTVYTTNQCLHSTSVEINQVSRLDGIRVYYFDNLRRFVPGSHTPPAPYYMPIVARKELMNYDIIHMHDFRTMLSVITHHYAIRFGVPYILQCHGSLPLLFGKQWLKVLYDFVWKRKILDGAAAVIALNRMEEQQCTSVGIREDKIRIIPNGIDFSEYEHLPERGALRFKLSLGPDWPLVLYLGRIHRIKGLNLLLDAFASLANEKNNVRLVLAGPDDGLLTELETQARSLGIEDRVIATGPLYNRDKLEAYVDADVYVLPSSYDTFPNTVLEALACGTPVVITDRCGIAGIIQNVGGLVVPYDKDHLTRALLKMLKQPDLGRKFGRQGRSLVAENYDWSVIADKVVNIYDTCIRQTVE